jgi:hypothetical protein
MDSSFIKVIVYRLEYQDPIRDADRLFASQACPDQPVGALNTPIMVAWKLFSQA